MKKRKTKGLFNRSKTLGSRKYNAGMTLLYVKAIKA